MSVISTPVEWIEENIDLSKDPTSAYDGLVTLDPYQIEPINAQFESGVNEVVVQGVPQTGKSVIWRFPLLYKIAHTDGPRWIIYESDDKAEDINAQQFDPLLRSIPELAKRLENAGRFAATKRMYRFPTGPVEFSGAGSEPTSKPARDGVADELDTWPITNPKKRKTLNSFRDRFTTWWREGQGCLAIVSSPNGAASAIGWEFDRSSKGRWHLQCLGCDRATMRSSRVDNLQWECTEDDTVIVETIRMICPGCEHEHTEADAVEMNKRGRYIHAHPNHARRGFQWGALASPRTKSWQWIAEMQMEAGSTAPLDVLENFAKVVKVMPYEQKTVKRDPVIAIKAHIGPLPDRDEICGTFFSADTQDNGWYWIVRSIDINRNTQRLAAGYVVSEDDLIDAWDDKYMGRQCIMGIIDEGGHRSGDVIDIVKDRAGLYAYRGNSRLIRWAPMKDKKQARMGRMAGNARHYQSELLYYIYTQTNRDKGNYWYLPENVTDEYISHIGSVQPDNKTKNGNLYENWYERGDDHYFDCEKMWRTLLDFAQDELKRGHWFIPPPWLYSEKPKTRRKPQKNMAEG